MLFASALLLALGGACGGGDPAPADGKDPDDPLPPPDPLSDYVFPETSHTGFDGTNTFKVPLSTSLTENVTWEVEDPTILDVAPATAPEIYAEYGETWAMVTTKKAGTTKVFAVSGGKRLEATVIVEAYDAANVAAGAARYNSPENPMGEQRAACASCHGLPTGVDHSPLEMAFFADADLLSAITTGMYPDGYVLMGVNHKWNVTDAEKAGIVPYLRSLPPRGF